MGRKSMDELLIQLGDLAREHLSGPQGASLRAMPAVVATEEHIVALEEEIAALEQAINQEDSEYQDFLERHRAEKAENEEIVKKWKKAVQGVEARSKELKKKTAGARATLRYEHNNLKAAEAKHADLELREAHDERKVGISKENLKKMRLQFMKKTRDIDEMERQLKDILTPRPGQLGAQGILAYKRLLEMEDEQTELKQKVEEKIAKLSEKIGELEEEDLQDAYAELDDALYELGVECYEANIEHPRFKPIVTQLEKLNA